MICFKTIYPITVIHRYIVQVPQTCRLTYFGHVTRMGSDRYPHLLLHGYTHGRRPKGRPRKKWLDNIRDDARRWAFQSMRLHNLLPTGQDAGTLYAIWAARAHWQRHCRHGNKSSKSMSVQSWLTIKNEDVQYWNKLIFYRRHLPSSCRACSVLSPRHISTAVDSPA